MSEDVCPCGSNQTFASCCGPLIEADQPAPSAERLMRSRYTAYTLKDLNYLLATVDPQRRLEIDENATRTWMEKSTFTRLEVVRASEEKNKGVVEFKAHYREAAEGPETVHHEIAKFRKQGGRWYFRPR